MDVIIVSYIFFLASQVALHTLLLFIHVVTLTVMTLRNILKPIRLYIDVCTSYVKVAVNSSDQVIHHTTCVMFPTDFFFFFNIFNG